MTRVLVLLLRLDGPGEMSGVVGGMDGGVESTLLLLLLLTLDLPLLVSLALLLRLLPGSLGLSKGKSWMGIRLSCLCPIVGLCRRVGPTLTVVLDCPGVAEPTRTVVFDGPGVAEPTPIVLGLVGVLNGPVSAGSDGAGEP